MVRPRLGELRKPQRLTKPFSPFSPIRRRISRKRKLVTTVTTNTTTAAKTTVSPKPLPLTVRLSSVSLFASTLTPLTPPISPTYANAVGSGRSPRASAIVVLAKTLPLVSRY